MSLPAQLQHAVALLAGTSPVTRFAPSPTGYLHLGHVVNALVVWGVAHAAGGVVRLRLEDHDRSRCRPEYEDAILEDLAWLGFTADGGDDTRWRQRDREARYAAALDVLAASGRVYACRCSRREIGGEYYDGRCRDLGLPADPGLGLRVRLDDGDEWFDDLRHGPQRQRPAAECGDVLIRDRAGHWTYQFAVVVDDLDQRITLVVRGDDLLGSTGRQLALFRLLGGGRPPRYLHHPLVFGPGGRKLSKSTRDSGIRDLRAAGLSAAEVIGHAAAAIGLVPGGTRLPAPQVAGLFRA